MVEGERDDQRGERLATSAEQWVLLSYRVPREPSTARIAIWRKLKRCGAAQLGDGLVALPADARTREQFDWLAEEVVQAGGTAGVWLARPVTAAQERALAQRMADARAEEYSALTTGAEQALTSTGAERARALRRLRGQWREITRRDFFPPPQRGAAEAALRELSAAAQERGQAVGP
ncbi:Chromate resistance protein ChrB [Kineococcus terrestris]|uniref:Chromate resistance protein ChrB n=1 Tax=Kineococcus terrestris TaxID=2044856 RepID=UPI0034DB53E1